VHALYQDGPGTPYYYWHGVNPAALAALGAGCLAYVALLNPLTYASFGPYRYLTASLPATVVAALVYLAASRLGAGAGMGGARHR
jgi:NCS1 family nucleobase:cation symporter-1